MIDEDVAAFVTRYLERLAGMVDATMTQRSGPRELHDAARRSADQLRRLADHPRLPGFLTELSARVAHAMLARRAVYVVSAQGGPLGWVAEHLAHNLYWDVPTGTPITTPMVIGAANVADLTAIHNNHPDPAHGIRYPAGGCGGRGCRVRHRRQRLLAATRTCPGAAS